MTDDPSQNEIYPLGRSGALKLHQALCARLASNTCRRRQKTSFWAPQRFQFGTAVHCEHPCTGRFVGRHDCSYVGRCCEYTSCSYSTSVVDGSSCWPAGVRIVVKVRPVASSAFIMPEKSFIRLFESSIWKCQNLVIEDVNPYSR